MSFFAELKRRRVGKVMIAYAAVAWAVTEACSVVLPALRLPEWTMTFVVVFLMIGFPVAMILAWIFDVGPTGIQRTEPLRDTPEALRTRLRIAYAAVVLLVMAGLGYLLYERGLGRAHASEPHGSIAVMPFTNLSGDPARDYFSDGMSEELLNLLARVPGLQVAARTSSFAYKGRNVDIREVGRELGVETVLEGSVRQAGDQVRITAQLIDTETGFHLWSETYDRKLADIFQVQDEIAGAIVTALRIQLAPDEKEVAQRTKSPTQNVEAYELFLKGRAEWKRRGDRSVRRSIELYQQALARDPAFARAHAALASAYVVLPGYTQEEDDEEFLKLAESSARQALVLDPNIGEAHAVLAQINTKRGDLLDAESGFFFAISLEPMEPTPHHWYSLLLTEAGRLDAALDQAQRAHELDPTAPVIALNLANVYFVRGENPSALRYAELARELGLQSKSDFGIEAGVAIRERRWDDAKRLSDLQPNIPAKFKSRIPAYIDALGPNPAMRLNVLAELRATDPNVVPQRDLVFTYVQLGELDQAYQILDAELDREPMGWTSWSLSAAWSPEGVAFRRDPRFAALAKRMGLIDYWEQYGFPDACRPGDEATPIVCS
jgi:TolB-like protein/tetratricopeptide (TPR) repeat protein